MTQTKACEVCSTAIVKRPSHSQAIWDSQVRFCSRSCYHVWRREHIAEIAAKATAARTAPTNEGHYAWKGDEAGYMAFHLWINKHYPKTGRCDLCRGEHRRTHRAMRDPAILSRDPLDWLELCPSCHKTYDNRRTIWARPDLVAV